MAGFLENRGIQFRFRCTYEPSVNGIVEVCNPTIKRIAALMQCSFMKSLYCDNVTLEDHLKLIP